MNRPVLVVDFGAQYAQLIARRVREASVYSEIVHHNITAAQVAEKQPAAIILSGGPSSVYEPGSPALDAEILELGIPVLAAIEEASDVSLFEQMERENRGRKNLSAWEQGTMYRRAIDDGLYSSLRRLAEGLGVDVSLVSKSVSQARLPDAVVAAFQSPLDIQFRWAVALDKAYQQDPDAVLSAARLLAGRAPLMRAPVLT